jgi:hypothetical protein
MILKGATIDLDGRDDAVEFFARLRFDLLAHARQDPKLFFPLMRLRKLLGSNKGLITLTRETELVIEGFWRSANSFATRAFLSAQSNNVLVANRTHAPATVIKATCWKIPTLILIRDPVDTVCSFVLKMPETPLEQALRGYINYYRKIYPYHDDYVVASFDEVTRDFGSVIERVNRRFGTDFSAFEHSETNVRSVFARIESVDSAMDRGDALKYSIPSSEKDKAKDGIKLRLRNAEFQLAVREARQIYYDFLTQPSVIGEREYAEA